MAASMRIASFTGKFQIPNRQIISNWQRLLIPASYNLANTRQYCNDSALHQTAKMPTQWKRPAGAGFGKKHKKRRTKRERNMEGGCTKEDILELDISELRSRLDSGEAILDQPLTEGEGEDVPGPEELPEEGSQVTVEVKALASTGEGLAVLQGCTSTHATHVYVVPLTVPGDVVLVKVFRHMETHTATDLISIVTPSKSRDESNIKCKYFGKCGGCQLQMLPYDTQLVHKRDIVVKAFSNFSNLTPEQVPEVGETIGSPLQYGYRTKLTPHFDQPRGPGTKMGKKNKLPFSACPDIGYMSVVGRKVLDIEDCPIGTQVLRKGMKVERERVNDTFGNFTTGSTILLRESTNRVLKNEDGSLQGTPPPESPNTVVVETDEYIDYKTCVTNPKANSFEYIGNHVFKNPAGSFFQNNNSILPLVTDYVRDRVAGTKPIRFLVDAYCGSGLFTIMLASLFTDGKKPAVATTAATTLRNPAVDSDDGGDGEDNPHLPSSSPRVPVPNTTQQQPLLFGSIGIDVSVDSIQYAEENARLSNLPQDACSFVAADASNLFSRVQQFDPDDTAVVLDPPRKGCDASFLKQLMEFAPRRIAYVSCNVHTQARDVGMLVRGVVDGFGNKGEEKTDGDGAMTGKSLARYEIESIRGFDFFPQTGHVEGVAILNRVDATPAAVLQDGTDT